MAPWQLRAHLASGVQPEQLGLCTHRSLCRRSCSAHREQPGSVAGRSIPAARQDAVTAGNRDASPRYRRRRGRHESPVAFSPLINGSDDVAQPNHPSNCTPAVIRLPACPPRSSTLAADGLGDQRPPNSVRQKASWGELDELEIAATPPAIRRCRRQWSRRMVVARRRCPGRRWPGCRRSADAASVGLTTNSPVPRYRRALRSTWPVRISSHPGGVLERPLNLGRSRRHPRASPRVPPSRVNGVNGQDRFIQPCPQLRPNR